MYPPFSPGFQLGSLTIRWYGIILVIALIVGVLVASRYVARRGQDRESVWNLALWVIIPAVLGARLYALFLQLPPGPGGSGYYIDHPLAILAIWQGGLQLYGALLGGGIALLAYLSIKKLPVPLYMDAAALALLAGQIIGRLGSFFDQSWYGPPTTAFWGVSIDPAYRVEPYTNLALYPLGQHFQPLFLYEIIWNALGLLLLWLLGRYGKRMRAGDLALIYLIWYPAGRFFLEFARTDVIFFPGTHLDSVHLVSVIVVIFSATRLLRHHRKLARLLAAPLLLGMETAPATFAYQSAAREEEADEEGLDMFEEYTFLQSRRLPGKVEEWEEEYEGTEDLDEWHGEHLSMDDLYDEGEEHIYEREIFGLGVFGLRWSVKGNAEEESIKSEDEEETEDITGENEAEEEEEEEEQEGIVNEGDEEDEETASEEESEESEAATDEGDSEEEAAEDEGSEGDGETGSAEVAEEAAFYEEAAEESEESEQAEESFEEAEDDAGDSSDEGDDGGDDGDGGDGGDGGDE